MLLEKSVSLNITDLSDRPEMPSTSVPYLHIFKSSHTEYSTSFVKHHESLKDSNNICRTPDVVYPTALFWAVYCYILELVIKVQ